MSNIDEESYQRIKKFVIEGTPDDIVRRYASLKRISETTTFGELDTRVVVVDTEATGLSFNHDELIQIAAARMTDGVIEDWFVTYVDPGKPIPEDIEHLTGISDADVQGAPSPAEALEKLVEFVGDSLVVAHNVEFDRTFTTKHPAGYPLIENTWVDSLDLSRIALPRLRSHRLIDLVHAFDTPVSTHRADADVAATCAIYRILLAGISCMPRSLVREIASLDDRGLWSTRPVFVWFAERYTEKHSSREEECAVADAKKTTKSSVEVSVDAHMRESAEEASDDLPDWARWDDAGAGAGDRSTDSGIVFEHREQEGAAPAGQAACNRAELRKPAGEELQLPGMESKKKRNLFSLYSLRQKRIDRLPILVEKSDAADVGPDDAPLRAPSEKEMDEAFSAEGIMGSIYSNYEVREEQREMARAIAHAYGSSRNLVVEAGTGVGKSMAYLIPSALLAKENDITVGVATKTNSLLDQLVYKELPRVAHALEESRSDLKPLVYAALKGISHYICLRKVGNLVDKGADVREVAGRERAQAPAIAALLSFIEQSEYDDMDGLKLDYRVLPRYAITTTSNDCLRRKCPYFNKLCFVHGARRRAQAADIVVTNQTFLYCDVAADGGLLPTARHWIVDEAHGAENEARRAFTRAISVDELLRLSEKVSDSGGSRNVFTRAEKKISGSSLSNEALFFGLLAKARKAGGDFSAAADEFASGMKELLYFDTENHSKIYERSTLWINDETREHSVFGGLKLRARELAERSDKLALCLQELVGLLEGIDAAAENQREIASCAMSLKELIENEKIIFEQPSDSYVYQATLYYKRDKKMDSIEAMPLDVGEKLNETLYARTKSVVYASATLTVDGSFSAFEKAMGLNQSEFSQTDELQLDSSFDFDNNMIVYVAKDMPEPNDKSYLPALEKLLIATHRAQKGSMLTLFTNRREMEKCYDVVKPELSKDNLRLICQKWGVSVKGLRDDFIKDESLSLFALKSFWEGFDAPGSTLKGVIIPKLPFNRPTDPLSRERALHDRAAWSHYVLPKAVIETKQAAGRLIRSANDTGVLILADKRILSKGYGKKFLNSLQSKTVRVCTTEEIVRALETMSREFRP